MFETTMTHRTMMRLLPLLLVCCFGLCRAAPVPTDPRTQAWRKERGWCGPKHEPEGGLPGLDDKNCIKEISTEKHAGTTPPRLDNLFFMNSPD